MIVLIAENTAQYVVPATSVLIGVDCSLCKKVINSGASWVRGSARPMFSDDDGATWERRVEDALVLTTSVESNGDTILSHTHISCIQGLVNEVPSVYMEFEDLRNSYMEATV